MRSFASYLLKLALAVLVLGTATDFVAEQFFYKIHHRSKVDVKGIDADVVFFGSSRCIHNVIPSIFDSITDSRSYNMGWSASTPREIYAAVKIFLHHNTTPKYIYLQVDASHPIANPGKLARQGLLKYHQRGLIDDYFTRDLDYELSIPLYKFMIYRDFGWREIIKTVFSNPYPPQAGYSPTYGHITATDTLTAYSLNSLAFQTINPWIKKTVDFCQNKNIKVIIFTSPYYNIKNPEILDKLSMYNVPYLNLSQTVKSPALYKDITHLNHKGAEVFTKIIANTHVSLHRVDE